MQHAALASGFGFGQNDLQETNMENGYQVTFFTQQGHRHGDQGVAEWLMKVLEEMGVRGATLMICQEGIGHRHHFHAWHLFSKTDQPVEVAAVFTEDDWNRVAARLNDEEGLSLFYAKTPVEFGSAGATPDA